MAAPLPFSSVFVTGAQGFVGRYLMEALRARLKPEAVVHPGLNADGNTIDLLDPDSLTEAVREARPDLVVHLAAQASVGQSAGAGLATWRVNVDGTLNLAEAVAAHAPRALVMFASSSEVYGAAFNRGPADETTLPEPSSVYGRTKFAAELALADTLGPENRLLVFRPGNHTGPGQDARFVLPAFANQIAAIEAGRAPPVVRVGSLTAERDFLDVRDVVAAYLDTLAVPARTRHETFNIASGHPVPISYLLDHLLALSSRSVEVEQDPARMRPSEVPRAEIRADKLAEVVGWQPQRGLGSTIAEVLDFARAALRDGDQPRASAT